jgi:hypothetical protein
MNQLLLLVSAAAMVGAAIYLGHQGLRLARINKMLEKVVQDLHDNPPHLQSQSNGEQQ